MPHTAVNEAMPHPAVSEAMPHPAELRSTLGL